MAERPLVRVVGLGPGGADLVTAGVLAAIEATPSRRLRTRRHPAAVVVGDAESFDGVYDAAERISEVYTGIVERLVRDAIDNGVVLYAVPGSPVVAERSVELLLEDPRVEVELLAALSFLDLTWSRLGVDPLNRGASLVDGHRFAVEAAGRRGPLLVGQCDTREVLSDIKLSLDEAPDAPVVILQRLGLPDEVVVEVDWWDLDRTVEPDHLTSVWIPELATPVAAEFVRVEELMRRLRAEDPWKASQTHESLKRYLLEETYETLEAIDRYDGDTGEGADELCSELGDLLYQVVFHSAVAAEAGWFTLADVAAGLHDKLVRRHPHVTGADDATGAGPGSPTVEELVRSWESDKRAEQGRGSVYDGIPAELPALARAAKVARKADPTPSPGPDPVDEASLGSALWELVRAAHAAGLDPEDALRRHVDRRVASLRERET